MRRAAPRPCRAAPRTACRARVVGADPHAAPHSVGQVLPATQMLPIIQSGAQLRINGNHKFKEGRFREALMMYLQVRRMALHDAPTHLHPLLWTE